MFGPLVAFGPGGTMAELIGDARFALAPLTDATLGEQLPFFGGRKMSRAAVMTLTTGDWADHYSQYSNYLRLNGMLPPTAKKPAM